MPRLRASREIPAYALYGEAPQHVAGPALHIETIESRSAGHHWKIAPHRHHMLHQVMFVQKGRGMALADGRRAQYRPPAVIVIPAGSVHGFEFEPGTSGHVLSVSVDLMAALAQREPGISAMLAQPAMIEAPARLLRGNDLVHGVRMLAREFARGDASGNLALHGWLEVVLGNLLRLACVLPDPGDKVVGDRRELMARFNELVERHFRESPAVADLARQLRVSGSRLRSTCLAATGQSPIQLIHARVLLEAKRQLHYTGSPVNEIAYALGFDDPAYFTRFFTRLTGASPRAFRRKTHDRAPARLGTDRPLS